MKKKVSISIDKEILEKAHELGINISKVCENSLRFYIQAIEQAKQKEQGQILGEASSKEGSVVGSLGFEPRIANAPGWYTEPSYTTTPPD